MKKILLFCAVIFSTPTWAQDITARIPSEIASIDWHKTLDLNSARVIFLMMRGLTEITPTGEIKPALAESWTASKDLKTYTFKIKRGIKWSDGKELTAADFDFAIRHVLNPKTGAFGASRFFIFKNGKSFLKGEKVELGVKVLDPYTLKLELERPAAFIPSLMAFTIAIPGRKDLVEKFGDKWTLPENIQVVGPYKLTSWQGPKMTLTANPTFYETKPTIENIHLVAIPEDTTAQSLFDLKKIDVVYGISRTLLMKASAQPEFHIFPHHRITAFAFNVKHPPFDNLKVRQAFAAATDRESLARLLEGNIKKKNSLYTAMSSWIPVGIPYANKNIGIPFDPKKAQTLLKEAGFPNGKGLPAVTIFFDNREDYKMMAERIQNQWKQILNVKVELVSMEWASYLALFRTSANGVFRIGLGSVSEDADFFTDVFASDSTIVKTNWTSAKYDELSYAAAGTAVPEQRQKLYDQLQRLLLEEDTVILPIVQEEFPMLISQRIQNLKVNLQSRTFFENARLTPLK